MQHGTFRLDQFIADPTNFIAALAPGREIFQHTVASRFTLGRQNIVFPVGASGLLRDSLTGEIFDYVRNKYAGNTLLTKGDHGGVFVPQGTEVDHHMQQYGSIALRNTLHASLELGCGPYELIEYAVTGGE